MRGVLAASRQTQTDAVMLEAEQLADLSQLRRSLSLTPLRTRGCTRLATRRGTRADQLHVCNRRASELALRGTVATLRSELADARKQRNELGEALRESKAELQVDWCSRVPFRSGTALALSRAFKSRGGCDGIKCRLHRALVLLAGAAPRVVSARGHRGSVQMPARCTERVCMAGVRRSARGTGHCLLRVRRSGSARWSRRWASRRRPQPAGGWVRFSGRSVKGYSWVPSCPLLSLSTRRTR